MTLWLLFLSNLFLPVSQNRVYHFINQSKSWCEARNYCRQYYTDLATVTNMTDQTGIQQTGNGEAHGWIGLHNGTGDREWHWSLPGVEFNTSKWASASDEPNDHDGPQNCVSVNENSEWFDGNCETNRCFICYNGSSFQFNITCKNWREAQLYCREHHTDLVSGLDQLDRIADELQQSTCDCVNSENNWWIGLSRDTWIWSDRSNSSFRSWDLEDRHMNHDYEHDKKDCAKLGHDGQWVRDYCNQSHPFICYDNYFVLVKENKTWEEALLYCRQHHRDLAWHDNPHLTKMVQERAKMADGEVVWVGLHYATFFEEWIWVTGDYVDSKDKNWKRPRSDNCGMSGAMETRGSNMWVKKPSHERYYFICAEHC